MKNFRTVFLAIACSAVFFAGTPTSSALSAEMCFGPPMDGTWFELKISAKACAVDNDEGSVEKESIKTIAYMYITDEGAEYGYQIFSEIKFFGQVDWYRTVSGTFPFANPTQYNIFLNDQWHIETPDGTSINIDLSGLFNLKLNLGCLTGGSFSTLGASISSGENPEGLPLYGGVKIKGKTIDENKVPENRYLYRPDY